MKAEVGDWIMFKAGPAIGIGVVRYALGKSKHHPWHEEYRTDSHHVSEDDILEVRKPAAPAHHVPQEVKDDSD